MSGRSRTLSLATLGVAVIACVPSAAETSTSAAPAPSVSTASPSPSFIRPPPNPSPTFLVHVVKTGETLTSIARLFGTTPRSIAYWNRARYPSLDPDSPAYEPDRIEVGWSLQLIPTAVFDEEELLDATPTPGVPAPVEPGPSQS